MRYVTTDPLTPSSPATYRGDSPALSALGWYLDSVTTWTAPNGDYHATVRLYRVDDDAAMSDRAVALARMAALRALRLDRADADRWGHGFRPALALVDDLGVSVRSLYFVEGGE